MAETTLVIMAAGMGSRFGGIKQLEPVGPSGEIIMDYSIYDAIKAGFNKVVFIIRKDLEKDFKEVIGNRIEKLIRVEYVFQELDDLPEGFVNPKDRTKPWGTGQAVLCCKDVVKGPFAVINADDYYGKEAFHIVFNFLNDNTYQGNQYCMAGFILGNTLSENGAVTRGVCKADENGKLVDIAETSGIVQRGNAAVAAGSSGEEINIDINSIVSMNMWGFKPGLFVELEKRFVTFLSNIGDNELKKEYLLPTVVGELIKENKAEVIVLKSKDRWFGVTYKEDKDSVVNSIRDLINQGVYPEKLF
ncbi:nucleotidyltransferase [Lachnospiraceae bacterium MD1]|uniref:Nucleotidyltransferase n=1 Tax=Variimorphobacter saccharofermentans TaxID=2755051 RepID=A0A839JWB8_9FIRM|nr:sugar phosphate nucleotidyltransferase [Variimorphobacter saccharofermentans]MBB2181557.1 nucleotidyltransferase [Variimorphobacter saccharofermentans]